MDHRNHSATVKVPQAPGTGGGRKNSPGTLEAKLCLSAVMIFDSQIIFDYDTLSVQHAFVIQRIDASFPKCVFQKVEAVNFYLNFFFMYVLMVEYRKYTFQKSKEGGTYSMGTKY